MNVDSERYLGTKRGTMKIENVRDILKTQQISRNELVDFFAGDISSDIYEPFQKTKRKSVI